MNKRTCNIIMASKGSLPMFLNSVNDEHTQIERVKKYMSEECDCPIDHYTDEIMDDILFEAMCDYIDTCDRPSFFLRQIKEVKRLLDKDRSLAEKIAIAFDLVEVRDKNKYVNGFTKELLEE